MTLPKLDEPYPSVDRLLKRQYQLHKEADQMLKDTGLLDLLSKFGTVDLGEGSYAYGLMAYPDLDLGIVSMDADKQVFCDMATELLSKSFVRKLSTADTVSFPPIQSGLPKGFWVALEIPYGDSRWGIDIWLQRPEWLDGHSNEYAERLAHLSKKQVVAILSIKHYLIFNGSYGKDFYSVDVYDDVLDKRINSVEEFKKLHSLSD